MSTHQHEQPETDNWLKDFQAAMREIRQVAHELESLAWHFDAVGNSKISDQLGEISGAIKSAEDAAGRAMGRSLNEACKQSGETLHQVFGLAMAGALGIRPGGQS